MKHCSHRRHFQTKQLAVDQQNTKSYMKLMMIAQIPIEMAGFCLQNIAKQLYVTGP